jgi:imidazole glycerol-phosphate synthase subunit HisH
MVFLLVNENKVLNQINVCILDYGSGNIKSVSNLISFLGYNAKVSNDIEDIQSSSHFILPGVGSFGSAMEKIKSKIPLEKLKYEIIQKGKPFLGICVGMQVLVEKGYEYGEHDGLGWLPGSVNKLDTHSYPSLHIGWNNINIKSNSLLFKGLGDINDFYFVHSYAVQTDEAYKISDTHYGSKFCSSVQRNNIYGVQFHPEKSQRAGQQLIHNFLSLK